MWMGCNFAQVPAAHRLPYGYRHTVIYKVNMPIAEQGMNSPWMSAASRYVQRESIPPMIVADAVRQSSPTVHVGVVGSTDVVVHRVSRSSVEPATASRLVEPYPWLEALTLVIGKFRAIGSVVISLGQHKAIGRARAVPRVGATFGLDCLANANRFAGSVGDVGKPDFGVFKKDTRHWDSSRVAGRYGKGGARTQGVVVDSAVDHNAAGIRFRLQDLERVARTEKISNGLTKNQSVVVKVFRVGIKIDQVKECPCIKVREQKCVS